MTACRATDPLVRVAASAMGTRFEIVLHGDDPRRLRAAGEEALGEVTRLHRRWSAFARESVVSGLNEHAGGEPVPVDAETLEVLVLAERTREASGGAFDAAPVGGVVVDEATRRASVRAGARLDLGGVAKGFALDAAGAVIREHGVCGALLHGGTSTILTIGERPEGGAWRVVVEAPGGASPRRFGLRDAALSVSGEGEQAGHIVDPRVKAPAQRAAVAVCVGSSAAVCDAWSTALYVLGGPPPRAPADTTMVLWSGGAWRVIADGVCGQQGGAA